MARRPDEGSLGGAGGGRFPATRGSVLRAVADADPGVRRRAWEVLAASYWRPVYKYLRVRWRLAPEDAEDLTQDLFAHALEKETFARWDPERARFRTFLRLALDGLAANRRKAAGRLKRGGDAATLSLDFAAVEAEVLLHHQRPAGAGGEELDPEEWFHREWVRGLFAAAVDRLREALQGSGRGTHFDLFARYDLAGEDTGSRPTYAELAAAHGLTSIQVTNYLAAARRELRRVVLAELAEATASEAEYRAEARDLLGVDPP